MDNQHKLIKGYRDLSQAEIDSINSIKLAEQDIGQLWQQVSKVEGVDGRMLALAKTNLQDAFMWFIRAVAQPLDVFTLQLPEETFIDRLRNERDVTLGNLSKLNTFIAGELFKNIPSEVQSDLTLQSEIMTQLALILSKRYDEATA